MAVDTRNEDLTLARARDLSHDSGNVCYYLLNIVLYILATPPILLTCTQQDLQSLSWQGAALTMRDCCSPSK
jgi:hypothetical protein